MSDLDVMIVVAHSSLSRGVPSEAISIDEYEVSKRASLAAMRNLIDDHAIELFSVGAVKGDTHYLPMKVDKVNGCNPSLAVEIHCNGSDLPQADYREVIYWPGSVNGKLAAQCVADALSAAFPEWKKCQARENSVAADKHELYFLRETKVASIIVEGLFLSHPAHVQRVAAEGGAEDYGLAIAAGLREFVKQLRAGMA